MALSFQIHPAQFKRVISNAIEFGKDKVGDATGCPYAMLHAESGDENTFSALTLSRRAAGRDWAEIEAAAPREGVVDLLVLMTGKANGQMLDTLEKLASTLTPKTGGVSAAKDSRLFVTIHHRQKMTVEHGGRLVAELGDVGDQPDMERRLERVEEMFDLTDKRVFTGPTALATTALGKLAAIKAEGFGANDVTVADIGEVVGLSGVAYVQVGDTFQGLLSTVDRPVYAAGGPHHSGPGRPTHLIDHKETDDPEPGS